MDSQAHHIEAALLAVMPLSLFRSLFFPLLSLSVPFHVFLPVRFAFPFHSLFFLASAQPDKSNICQEIQIHVQYYFSVTFYIMCNVTLQYH